MNKRLGVIVLLGAILMIGCSKKEEEAGQANEASAKPASNPAVAVEAGEESIPAAAIEPMAAPAVVAAVATLPTKLGDAAYPLTGLTWIKGQPVTISPGKVYVVEFWATWCPPCRESIPHLTQLQAKYKDRVTFVGISQEKPGVVKPFVSDQGDKMAYAVAVDAAGEVSKGYMRAFGQGGIPTAFVVDAGGKVVWHGHPMSPIEQVLDQVLAGTYSIPG